MIDLKFHFYSLANLDFSLVENVDLFCLDHSIITVQILPHTSRFYKVSIKVVNFGEYSVSGPNIDDAKVEAFDKIVKNVKRLRQIAEASLERAKRKESKQNIIAISSKYEQDITASNEQSETLDRKSTRLNSSHVSI